MDKILQIKSEYTKDPIISDQEPISSILPSDPISQTGEEIAREIDGWKKQLGAEEALQILSTIDLLHPILKEQVIFDRRYVDIS